MTATGRKPTGRWRRFYEENRVLVITAAVVLFLLLTDILLRMV